MKRVNFLLVLAIAMFISAPAFAGILFFDNFESGAHGDPLGTAVVGTWALSGGVPDNSLKLKVPTAGGGLPASIYGAQYGATIRGMPEVAGGLYNYADAPFAVQSNPSSLVRFEAEVYGQNAGSTACDLKIAFLSGTTESNFVQISGTASGGVVSVGGTATSLTWALGTWHHVTMDYNPMASTFALSIDNQTLTGLAMTTPSTVSAVRLEQTSAGQDRWSVFDNVTITSTVPEPSSLALAVSAMLGLVAYAWQKRR